MARVEVRGPGSFAGLAKRCWQRTPGSRSRLWSTLKKAEGPSFPCCKCCPFLGTASPDSQMTRQSDHGSLPADALCGSPRTGWARQWGSRSPPSFRSSEGRVIFEACARSSLGLPLTLRPDEVTSTHLNGASALVKVHVGDALGVLRSLANNSFNSCITSPPYFQQRDYGVTGQIGLEPTPDDYIRRLVECFREVRRVLRRDGTFWLGSGTASVRPQEAAKTYSAFRGGLPLHCRPMAGSFGRTS